MAWVNIIDLFYPVGIIVEFNDKSDPAMLFGGSWTQITTSTPYRWRRVA